MDYLFWITIGLGVVLIIIGLLIKEENPKKIKNISEKEEDLIKTIGEADDAIEQLNGLSKQIFDEQEEKYKELLYLYQIIDEKKKEIAHIPEGFPTVAGKRNIVEEPKKPISKNDEIFELFKTGLTPAQIAKRLNMGQGEVNLILELRKRTKSL